MVRGTGDAGGQRGRVGEPGLEAKSLHGLSAAAMAAAAPENPSGRVAKEESKDGRKGAGRRSPGARELNARPRETGAASDVNAHVDNLFRSIQHSEEERAAQAAVREARQARHARLLGSWGVVLGEGGQVHVSGARRRSKRTRW